MIFQNDEGRGWGAAFKSALIFVALAGAAYLWLQHIEKTRPEVLTNGQHWLFGQLGDYGGAMLVVYALLGVAALDLFLGRWARYFGLLVVGTGLAYCFAAQFESKQEEAPKEMMVVGNEELPVYWTFRSKKGKEIEARLISFDGITVKLQRKDGEQFTQNIGRFSKATREEIRSRSGYVDALDRNRGKKGL